LEELVVSLFEDIKKKDVDMPCWNDPIYKKDQLATKTVVIPVKDVRLLYINFLIPDQNKYYKSKVNKY